MIKKIIFLLLLVSVFACGNKEGDIIIDDFENEGLFILIEGMRNDDGQIILDLMDENENKIDTVYQTISNNICEITITDLPAGRYAFQYIHDENLNKEFDANGLGIPLEGYGYSRNAPGTFGPPKMEEMVFEYDGSLEMTCRILYLF